MSGKPYLHAEAQAADSVDWPQITGLYDALLRRDVAAPPRARSPSARPPPPSDPAPPPPAPPPLMREGPKPGLRVQRLP